MNNKSKGILVYLLIAFGMAWILWAVVWLAGLSPRNPLQFQLVILPGAFAPAVAALIVRKWVTREGFADAGLRLNLHRWPYYLLALFSPLISVLVILALAILLGVSQPDLSLQRAVGALLPELDLSASPPPPLFLLALSLTINAVVFTPVLWGEEFGWRGHLQIRLLSHRPLMTALTTGLIWGIWHYPQVLMGYQYPDSLIPGLFVFPVSTILLSIIFGWLRLRNGQRVVS